MPEGEFRAFVPSFRLAPRIPVRDNKPFVEIFDRDSFKKEAAKTAKTVVVVVDQDPDEGEFVPAGTAINVVLTVKDVIPVKSFTKIEPKVAETYKDQNIGKLLDDLNVEGVKDVIDQEKKDDYDKLSTDGRQKVNNFMKKKLGLDPDDPAVDRQKVKKAYSDIKFLNDL